MKKFIRVIALAMALLCTLFVFCACGSELDRAVKSADKVVAARNEGSGYPNCDFSSELVYIENEDRYEYVISVEYGQSTISADSITNGLRMNIDGYFDDFENVDVVVKFYVNGALYKEYKNWELHQTYSI